jgi:hypothetical protein
MTDERGEVAEELRRVREEVRRRARLPGGEPGSALPDVEVRLPQAAPREEPPPPHPSPCPPDATAVNETWRAEAPPRGGIGRLLRRLLDRLLASRFEAQQTFNARQVQLDNAMLRYIEERFAATHRHYDRVLGLHGRHLGEADERHLILQEELVAHVHDLVKRIDLVLEVAERGRMSLEAAVEEVRAALRELEKRSPPR